MNKNIDLELLNYIVLPYAISLERDIDEEDGSVWYIAQHPELPGCVAQGETARAAILNLHEARSDYIRALLRRGMEVPLPASPYPAPRVMRIEVSRTSPRQSTFGRIFNYSSLRLQTH